jgi:hypothetical protein
MESKRNAYKVIDPSEELSLDCLRAHYPILLACCSPDIKEKSHALQYPP